MNPEDVKAIIDQLIKTGEFLATKAFAIAVRQAITYGIMDLVGGLVLIIMSFLFFFLGNKYDWDDDLYVPAGLISLAIGMIAMLASIRYFINPEWYAIQMLIEMIK